MPMRTVRWVVRVALCFLAASAQAEVGTVQSAHGTVATIVDLGNGIGLQSDPHEETRPIVPPRQSAAPVPAGPHGDVNRRTATPFGSPQPPNQLTPAPVLPFRPNSPLMPGPSAPPASTPALATGEGRFGR